MQTKKKICKRCNTEKYLFARGMCKPCDMIENPKKYLINKKQKETKVSITSLKKKLDAVFSLYIRLRDADENGTVQCFTSGQLMQYKKAHAGHYISRRHLSTRWDEVNVQVQSVKENIFNQGNAPVFAIRLDDKYGQGTAKSLVEKSLITFKENKDWYLSNIEYYSTLVTKLKSKINEL